ncbi:MAG: hypothetical protein WA951_02890, partial [Leeuwenhoekiella sp.]
MNKFSILFISSLLLLACDKAEKEDHFEIGNLTLSKSQPQPGDQIDISYQLDNSASENTPEAFLYYITDDKNHIEDLSLTENNGTFKAQVKIPDSATAIAFNFKTGETYDTNEKNGYVIPLYSDQSIIEGAASSVAWFKLTNGSQYGFDIPVDSAFTVINEEYKNNTEQMDAWSMPLINIANQSDKKRAEVLMQNYLDNLRAKNNLTEQEYNNINRIYDLQKNKIAQDSITKIALEKYPKGALARREYIDQMRNTKGLEAEKAILDAYEKNIGSTGFERDYILNIVASSYIENSDFKNFEKYAEMQDSETSIASLYNNQAWDMAQNDKNLDEAEKFSK